VREPQNPHDANAIAIYIGDKTVGYLPRGDAARYLTGLIELETAHSAIIGLRGVVVGGGLRDDGLGLLGVFLRHNPADFGLTANAVAVRGTGIDTGLSDAIASDEEDDTYDLGWATTIPSDPVQAISTLKRLLTSSTAPIERHYIYHHLEDLLYRSRRTSSTALDEFDACCKLHDAEIDAIRSAFLAKWGMIPRLHLYKQMCIRESKSKNFAAAKWWAERGIAVYDGKAAKAAWADDLAKRAENCQRKVFASELRSHGS
jgi:hypothetical protein